MNLVRFTLPLFPRGESAPAVVKAVLPTLSGSVGHAEGFLSVALLAGWMLHLNE